MPRCRAVYALARRIDDIGDGDLPIETKRAALADVRAALKDLNASNDVVLVAVADAAGRMPIPVEAFGELVDGVEMDLAGTRFETFEELVRYCRCVAGSIGRLCLGVFGARDLDVAPDYADSLGVALQQTNILRDIREDLILGRVYLPSADLRRFGVELRLGDDGALRRRRGAHRADPLLRGSGARLVRRRAAADPAAGPAQRRLRDRRCRASTGGCSTRIAAQPYLVRDRRLSLSGWQKATVAARALAGRPA